MSNVHYVNYSLDDLKDNLAQNEKWLTEEYWELAAKKAA